MGNIGHNSQPEITLKEWIFSVMERDDVSEKAKHMAHVIYHHWDFETNSCKLTSGDFSRLTSLGKSTVKKYASELKNIVDEVCEGKGRAPNEYKKHNIVVVSEATHKAVVVSDVDHKEKSLVVSDVDHKAASGLRDDPLQEREGGDYRGGRDRSSTTSRDNTKNINQTHSSHQIKKSDAVNGPKRKKIAYTKSFEDFYLTYPKKGTKAESFKEWKKLSTEDREWALDSLPAYQEMLKEDGGWRKPLDPVRYIKRRMFEDFSNDGSSPEKPWGWWRGRDWSLFSIDEWREMVAKARPNGTWPWDTLGPPPGHPECLLPTEAQSAYGDKYFNQVQELIQTHGESE